MGMRGLRIAGCAGAGVHAGMPNMSAISQAASCASLALPCELGSSAEWAVWVRGKLQDSLLARRPAALSHSLSAPEGGVAPPAQVARWGTSKPQGWRACISRQTG